MAIDTKYNVDDRVYYFKGDSVYNSKIISVSANVFRNPQGVLCNLITYTVGGESLPKGEGELFKDLKGIVGFAKKYKAIAAAIRS